MEIEQSPTPTPADADTPLFLWRSGRIVLIGRRQDDRWVLARGWRSADCLSHVRQWRFGAGDLFTAQVRRLAHEEVGHIEAEKAARLAAGWIATVAARRSA